MSISQIGIYGGVGTLSQNKSSPSVVSSWWLSGEISSANCVAAYQPKGAASYTASKINLANPGTYNATDGTAYPTWDATNGWKFLASSSQFLSTLATPNTAWSMICRFSDVNNTATSQYLIGSYNGNLGGAVNRFYLHPNNGLNQRRYAYGYAVTVNGIVTTGVMAICGVNAYLNGVSDGTVTPNSFAAGTGRNLTIGAFNNTGTPQNFLTGNILAVAIYNTVITASQVSALTTAMNAL